MYVCLSVKVYIYVCLYICMNIYIIAEYGEGFTGDERAAIHDKRINEQQQR